MGNFGYGFLSEASLKLPFLSLYHQQSIMEKWALLGTKLSDPARRIIISHIFLKEL